VNAATAYAKLSALGPAVIRTSEASAVLGISVLAAAQTLRRLGQVGLLRPLSKGLFWTRPAPIDPWVALPYLALPYPAYGSLYSALSLHGVLSQLPVTHYAVTLGRPRRIATAAGTFSLHRIAPALFDGFVEAPSGARVATVEKALFDIAYFGVTRARIFARPPELDIPRRLDRAAMGRWVSRIQEQRRRKVVSRRLDQLLKGPPANL
jgi:predicted transcriptional regulator of viral defense system